MAKDRVNSFKWTVYKIYSYSIYVIGRIGFPFKIERRISRGGLMKDWINEF